jgi:hypothetical protein
LISENSTILMLDFDHYTRPQLLHYISRRWGFVFRFPFIPFGQLCVQSIDVRRTRHGFHIRIFVENKIPPMQGVLLQLALGSDYRRECLNYNRIASSLESWNVLFYQKFDSVGRILSEERPDPQLSRTIAKLIVVFQKGFGRRPHR